MIPCEDTAKIATSSRVTRLLLLAADENKIKELWICDNQVAFAIESWRYKTEHSGLEVSFYICTPEVLRSNLGQGLSYSDWDVSWLS
jgi:hypothetical protein